jgi:hypothetical protein
MEIVYIAAPFKKLNDRQRYFSVNMATQAAAIIFRKGHLAFSPLTHSFPIHKVDTQILHNLWLKLDLNILTICTSLAVLQLPGWTESMGVTEEIYAAKQFGLNIYYFDELKSIQNFEFTE